MKAKLLVVLLGVLFIAPSYGQTINRSIKDVYEQSEPIIDEIINLGWEIVRMEYDILSTEKATYRMLYPDYEYGIIAFGDQNRYADVDLIIYVSDGEGGWEKVASDTEDSNEAIIKITPTEEAEYKFVVKASKYLEDWTVGNYCLIVCHE